MKIEHIETVENILKRKKKVRIMGLFADSHMNYQVLKKVLERLQKENKIKIELVATKGKRKGTLIRWIA